MNPVLLFLLALPAVPAQDPAPAPPVDLTQQSPDAQFDALQARHDASELGYPERFAAFRDEYLGIARAHAGSEVGMKAEMFLLTGIWWMDEAERPAAAEMHYEHLIEAYGATPHIALALEPVRYLIASEKRDALLERIGGGSKHDIVKATVLFFRGSAAKGEARTAMLTELKKKYGGLKHKYSSFADLVDAYLNPHAKADLAVGKSAPEIVGVDLYGKPMKLSDYRGKVVVLDFWGDW